MDNIIQEGEQALEGGGNNQQGNMGGGGGNMDQQGQGNMDQQSGGSSSGGGLMGGLEKTGEDAMIDQEANQFLSKEGLPTAADGVVDTMINKEL